MKKTKRIIFAAILMLFLLCLCFAGCRGEAQKDALIPETPTALRLDADEVLTWTEDKNADGYVVSVDGKEYETAHGGFDLFEILNQEKNYEIRVKALYGREQTESAWSERLYYTVDSLGELAFEPEGEGYSVRFVLPKARKPKGKVIIPAVNPRDGKPVTAIGEYMFNHCGEITGVLLPDTVTTIGHGAFSCCEALRRVRLPAQCRMLKSGAFVKCSELWDIRLPSGLQIIADTVFNGCAALENIEIPDTVTVLGGGAFAGCASLRKMEIPGSVRMIESGGSGMFSGCDSLATVTVAKSNTVYRSESNCIIRRADGELVAGARPTLIPSGVKSIGSYAFSGCTGFTKVIMLQGVKSIGPYAFSGCTDLTEVVIPDGVESIGNFAFWNCAGLTSVVIPGSVESIGNGAFYQCRALASVTLSEGIKRLGKPSETDAERDSNVFGSCTSLRSLAIPSTVELIAPGLTSDCAGLMSLTVRAGNSVYRVEGNCIIRRADGVLIAGCQSSVVPAGVTAIGAYAFSGCTGLRRVVLPAGVKSIGRFAFAGSGLTEIEFPSGLESIGDDAFFLTDITELHLPDSVVSIGGSAFSYTDITELYLPDSVVSIGGNAFSDCEQLRIAIIPAGVATIEMYAFNNCPNLTVILPKSVGTIEIAAFSGTVYTSAAKDQIPDGWKVRKPGWDSGCAVAYDCTFAVEDGRMYVTSFTWKYRKGVKGDIIWSNLTTDGGLRVPTRDGYTFMGWSTEEGSDTVTIGKTEQEDKGGTYETTLSFDALGDLPTGTVLYAVWAPNP